MRISELLQLGEAQPRRRSEPRVIRAARGRFKKELADFVNAYHEQFEGPFKEFLREKATMDPPLLFGIKDGPLGRNVKSMPSGIMHTHIVRGNALVVYKVDQDYLTLYRVCDHSETDPTALSPLADLIRSIDRIDQWDIIPVPTNPIDPEILATLIELFREMTQNWDSIKVLRQFAKMTSDNDPDGQRSGMKAYLDRTEAKFPKLKSLKREQVRQQAIEFVDRYNQALKSQ